MLADATIAAMLRLGMSAARPYHPSPAHEYLEPAVPTPLVRRLLAFTLACMLAAGAGADQHGAPRVALQTSHGNIVLELAPEQAPDTVRNFLAYVDAGFYDGTVFHRVIDGFMVQGGGFAADYEKKPTREAIRNEADNGLRNQTGTIAMARTTDPHSATAQFFINLADNEFLDHRDRGAGWGYAVFGRVVEGMEVVRAIAALPTGAAGPFRKDVPLEPVTIVSAERVGATEKPEQ